MYCSCGKTYSRHRETIDPQRHMCGVCHGKLSFMGKFDRSGALVSGPGGAAAGKEGKEGEAGGVAGGGVPHAYRQFVKQNFAEVKSSQPPGEVRGGRVLVSGGGAQSFDSSKRWGRGVTARRRTGWAIRSKMQYGCVWHADGPLTWVTHC